MWGAKINSLIDRGQFWRLATSSLLHANVTHLAFNCFSLNSIGPMVEMLTGPRRFIAVYFSSALAGSLMSYRCCESPAVGASGAIFGLVGAYAVYMWRHKSYFGNARESLEHIGRVVILNMGMGLLSRGIDNWGHLGGLLGGVAVAWFLGPAWQYQHVAKDGRVVFKDSPRPSNTAHCCSPHTSVLCTPLTAEGRRPYYGWWSTISLPNRTGKPGRHSALASSLRRATASLSWTANHPPPRRPYTHSCTHTSAPNTDQAHSQGRSATNRNGCDWTAS